ncbi:MAG: lipopolysaccharide biosynthesis protein [Mangrovibacterium sp.]
MNSASRVAINTSVQYIQLILNVLIGLFSVRIILESLGASDYGIYNLLGGVIGLLTFISSSLSQTSIRFISVSLGKNDISATRKTFNACFSLHLIMAILLVVVLEVVSIFLFNGFLNIPKERIHAAQMIFHCMVFTLFLNIAITPFRAILVAHEKFIFTSGIGILDSVCKLLIAIIIARASIDKLKLYGVLVATLVSIDVILYSAYAILKYRKEISLEKPNKGDLCSVMGFAGWTLFDVIGSVANRQGYAVLLNKFFGPVTNAVFALAGQVEGHLYIVSSSVIDTMKPQIMKTYGAGETDRTFRLSMTAGKFGFSMMSLLSIPLIVMMPEILSLWLKDVPEGTALFARLIVLACMFEQLTRGLVYANQAVGNIKWFSIIVSTIRMSALPVSWILFHFGATSYVAMVVFLVCEIVGSFSRVAVMSKIADLKISVFIFTVLFQIFPPVVVAFCVCIVSYCYVGGIIGIIIASILTALSFALVLYGLGLTSEEKMSIKSIGKAITDKIVRK